VLAALFPRLTGCRVMHDIHDLVPEFYTNKFQLRPNALGARVLRGVERLSCRFADHVIVSNHLWQRKLTVRSVPEAKCSVFINRVDTRIFRSRPRRRKDSRYIIIFPGGLQWHQGVDIAIQAMDLLRSELPQAELHIYGEGNMKEEWLGLADALELNGKVAFFPPMPIRQIAEVMAEADLGVVPKRADSFGNEAYSTKIMEFMSQGVPIVASQTDIDNYYFDDSLVHFFESGDPRALAKAIVRVATDEVLRARLVNNSKRYTALNSWEEKKQDYLDVVDALCGSRG
jgi:glycosyltransferase involved in cell wall biosynthesis